MRGAYWRARAAGRVMLDNLVEQSPRAKSRVGDGLIVDAYRRGEQQIWRKWRLGKEISRLAGGWSVLLKKKPMVFVRPSGKSG